MACLDSQDPDSSPCKSTSSEVQSPVEERPTGGVRKRRRGFPDRVYPHAADLFQAAHVEKPLSLGLIRYAMTSHPKAQDDMAGDEGSKHHKLWAYELAFNTLKFQKLLEDVLLDSCFYPSQHMPDDLMALVLVMLYDLQDRKFQPRGAAREELIGDVRMVEDSLLRFRTRLAASLARYRIKHGLLSIQCMLPKNMREKHQRRHKVPLCAWVNTLKTSIEDVCEALKAEGFVRVEPHTHLEGSVFCVDTHCADVLLFPQSAQEQLEGTKLLMGHTLILQEKSRSLAAWAIRPLLVKDTDILLAGSFSAQTAAHVAVHASASSARLYVCGVPDNSARKAALETTLSAIGCQNVELLPDHFSEMNKWDSRMQKVGVILLLPRCTVSALSNPVAHVLQEDGDRELLQELSQDTISVKKLESLIDEQNRDLNHALTFPKVQAVVYCTCSVYAEENEQLVKRVLENRSVKVKQPAFKIVSTGWKEENEQKFFRLEASDAADGCFICVLKREEQAAPSVQEILARAAAKGLLAGLYFPELSDQAKRKERKKGRQKGAEPLPPLVLSNTDRNKLVNNAGDLNGQFAPIPEPPDVHFRTVDSVNMSTGALKTSLKSPLHDSSAPLQGSSDSLNEYLDTQNDSSLVLSPTGCLDDDEVLNREFDSANQRPKAHKKKLKASKQTRQVRNKSKSRTRATRKSRRRLKQGSQKRTKDRKQNLIKMTAPVAPKVTPMLPQTQLSANHFPTLARRRRGQLEALTILQDVPGPRNEMVALNETIRLKQEVERHEKKMLLSMQGLLPPISSRSPSFHSSISPFRLPEYLAGSTPIGSYPSSSASTSSSRSESQNSILSRM